MINITELGQTVQVIPLIQVEEDTFTVDIVLTNNTTLEVEVLDGVSCQSEGNGFVFTWGEILEDGSYTADFQYNRRSIFRDTLIIDLVSDEDDPEQPQQTTEKPSYDREKNITKHDVDSVVIKRSRTKNIFTR